MQPMLAGQVDYVIGVETHRDSNTAAVVEAVTGAVVDELQCATDAMGYRRCYAFATGLAPGRRVWAIEGSGSFGSGLTTFLLERGEWVVEIDRPSRPARRNGAKSDELDAVRAAREALSGEHLAAPKTRPLQARTVTSAEWSPIGYYDLTNDAEHITVVEAPRSPQSISLWLERTPFVRPDLGHVSAVRVSARR